MFRTRLVAAAALSTSLVLAGCGGGSDSSSGSDSDDASSAPTVAAATGPAVETDAFTFNAPDGWEQNDEAAPGALAFAADPEDSDGFADNVNVIEDPSLAGASNLGQIEDGIETSLKSAKATDIEIGDPADVDGSEAATVSSVFALNSVEYAVKQYAVKRGDSGYIVTFSYSVDRPAAEMDEIAQSVIASWSWAS